MSNLQLGGSTPKGGRLGRGAVENQCLGPNLAGFLEYALASLARNLNALKQVQHLLRLRCTNRSYEFWLQGHGQGVGDDVFLALLAVIYQLVFPLLGNAPVFPRGFWKQLPLI